uniref:Putative secreted protein n=1 Tax=Ixodes ricinus TaxID=34613 RepID=A0A6B0UQ97_IXORI
MNLPLCFCTALLNCTGAGALSGTKPLSLPPTRNFPRNKMKEKKKKEFPGDFNNAWYYFWEQNKEIKAVLLSPCATELMQLECLFHYMLLFLRHNTLSRVNLQMSLPSKILDHAGYSNYMVIPRPNH